LIISYLTQTVQVLAKLAAQFLKYKLLKPALENWSPFAKNATEKCLSHRCPGREK